MPIRSPNLVRAILALLFALWTHPGLAAPETLRLENGDQITGEVVSRTAAEVVIEHAALGRMTIPAEALRPDPAAKPGLFGTSFLRGWKRSLGVGLTGSEGNTDESSLRIALLLDTDTPDTRWKIEGAYKLSTTEGDRDDHFAHLITRHDWLFEGSRWFARTGALYFYDEFEDWKHRVGGLAGPGYLLVDTETLDLDVTSGLSATYEFGDKEQLRPEALLGLEVSWQPNDGHAISLANFFFQQLDASEVRNRTRLAWKMRILDSEHLSISLGADNEYDTDSDDERNNLKYWTSLDYEF